MIFNTYDVILQDANNTPQDAIDYAMGLVWCEIEVFEQNIGHYEHIDDVNGVGVYYDYGADYYFFTDLSEDE